MKKMADSVRENRKEELFRRKRPVENFMGGVSYEWNPIDTLKMVTASSIFGEPSYYRNGEFAEAGVIIDSYVRCDEIFKPYLVSALREFYGKEKKTSEIMEEVIDAALDHDFKAALEWAVTLRTEFSMRLNPQVIMVRAAVHPKRQAFTGQYPGLFAEINRKIMSRADEPASQLTYYLYKHGSKKGIPALLKRSWADRIENASRYEIAKYRNAGVGMIDTVRICHAKGEAVDELMRTGKVSVGEDEKTWETLRSNGAGWREILDTIPIGHMALLRNLRGIFSEISDMEQTRTVLDRLKAGVPGGKQFPFRYYSAYQAISAENELPHKQMILDTLEACMDISCGNMPKLKGRTMCLSDNSGSAWGALTSEYGTVKIAHIDNLSSVITAYNSDEGTVGKFGDKLISFDISKRNGILKQAEEINKNGQNDVGGATECGIWLFFDEAIRSHIVYDTIFIYSDMQAGHGGLYGTKEELARYSKQGYAVRGRYIDAAKLIDVYRKQVNPKVNVFSVQTAGYNNTVIPENGYRTALLYGWTGRELVYADAINRFWDEIDEKRTEK